MKIYDGSNWKNGDKASPSADGIMSKEDKVKLDLSTPSNVPNSLMSRNSSGTSRVQHLYIDGNDPKLDQAVRRDFVENAIQSSSSVVKGQGVPTVPVVANGVYIDTNTGDQYIGVDRGPGPIENLSTNPSFENAAPNFGSTRVSNESGFKVVSLNLLYSNLEESSDPDYKKWANRKVKIASYIQSNNVALLGAEESYTGFLKTQLEELYELLPSSKYGMVQVTSANNGIIYDKDVFDLIEYDKDYYPINVLEASPGMERNLTVALFRHKSSDQRLIYAVTHFTQGSEFENKRQESIIRVTDFLNNYRNRFKDLPGIILSGDFNKLYVESGTDPFYEKMKSLGLEASRNKAANPVNTNQGSWHGFNVNGNSSKNWIDDNYSNAMLDVVDTKLDLFFANGTSLPLDQNKFLSDHHPVLSTFKFRYNMNVASNNATSAMTTGGNAIVYYSGSWSSSDKVTEGSLAVKATGSTSSCAYPAGQSTGQERIRWTPGKTYTVSATVRLSERQTNSAGWARAITVGVEQNGSTQFSYAASERGTNAAGVYRVTLTFTLPSDATNSFIRLMNGSADQTIWWDDLMITEGDYKYAPFNGDSLGCYWTGPAHGSTSIYPGPSWVKVN